MYAVHLVCVRRKNGNNNGKKNGIQSPGKAPEPCKEKKKPWPNSAIVCDSWLPLGNGMPLCHMSRLFREWEWEWERLYIFALASNSPLCKYDWCRYRPFHLGYARTQNEYEAHNTHLANSSWAGGKTHTHTARDALILLSSHAAAEPNA